MTESNMDEKTRKLIAAARALASHQRDEFAQHQALAALEQKRASAQRSIDDAEFNLATAQSALASARVKKLSLQRRLSSAQLAVQQLYEPLELSRRQLWSVCSDPDEQLIVASAKTYGECSRNYFLARAECEKSRSDLDETEAQIASASKDCEEHKAAVARAKVAFLAIDDGFGKSRKGSRPVAPSLFDLERAVSDAAHELTGTDAEKLAYSFIETIDLPVWAKMQAEASAN